MNCSERQMFEKKHDQDEKPVATHWTQQTTTCTTDQPNRTNKKFIISCTELKSFRLKKWHHEFGFINSDKRFSYRTAHQPTNQFELSCSLVASFLFITFDVITLPASASNRRTSSTTLAAFRFSTNFHHTSSTTIFTSYFSTFFFLIIEKKCQLHNRKSKVQYSMLFFSLWLE